MPARTWCFGAGLFLGFLLSAIAVMAIGANIDLVAIFAAGQFLGCGIMFFSVWRSLLVIQRRRSDE